MVGRKPQGKSDSAKNRLSKRWFFLIIQETFFKFERCVLESIRILKVLDLLIKMMTLTIFLMRTILFLALQRAVVSRITTIPSRALQDPSG